MIGKKNSAMLGHGCRKIVRREGNFSRNFWAKRVLFSMFDSINITEFVNQNLLFSFNSSL